MTKKILEHVILSLVSKPDLVVIKEVHEDNASSYQIVVSDKDRGLVIGKDGQTIRALQALAQALGKQGQVIEVTVVR